MGRMVLLYLYQETWPVLRELGFISLSGTLVPRNMWPVLHISWYCFTRRRSLAVPSKLGFLLNGTSYELDCLPSFEVVHPTYLSIWSL